MMNMFGTTVCNALSSLILFETIITIPHVPVDK